MTSGDTFDFFYQRGKAVPTYAVKATDDLAAVLWPQPIWSSQGEEDTSVTITDSALLESHPHRFLRPQ